MTASPSALELGPLAELLLQVIAGGLSFLLGYSIGTRHRETEEL